jgi:hypothetical protein
MWGKPRGGGFWGDIHNFVISPLAKGDFVGKSRAFPNRRKPASSERRRAYPTFRVQGLQMGSSIVEAACKTVGQHTGH